MTKENRVKYKIKLAWFNLWLYIAAVSMFMTSIVMLIGIFIRNLLLSIGDLSLQPLKDTTYNFEQVMSAFTE